MVMLLTYLLKAGIDASTVVVARARPRLLMTVSHVTQVIALRVIPSLAALD